MGFLKIILKQLSTKHFYKMGKENIYANITAFNYVITNERETRASKYYYVPDDEALEKAAFVKYLIDNREQIKAIFTRISSVIDLAYGSGNLSSKVILENDLSVKALVLNDRFLKDTNQNVKDLYNNNFSDFNCSLTERDFFDSTGFNEKFDLLIFNPTSGGKPFNKDYNKNGIKSRLLVTLSNILSDKSIVIFNGKNEEFEYLFPSFKSVYRYIPQNGNDLYVAYRSAENSLETYNLDNGYIKEYIENDNTAILDANLDALEDAISLQIQKIKPPKDDKAIVSISENPEITAEKIKDFALFLETLPEEKRGSILEAIGNHHLTNEDINVLLGRKKSLETFKLELDKATWEETQWQTFFEDNPWIFGYGLNYQYLKILQREAHVSGVDLDGKNEVIGDFLMGTLKFTVLVELKRPDTDLFGSKIERSEMWKLSNDLNSAMSQILAQKAEWQIKSEKEQHDKEGNPIKQKTIDPKTILIIGNSSQYVGETKENRIKAKTFELYRRNSRNIEILTYDELYERADFIVNQTPIG